MRQIARFRNRLRVLSRVRFILPSTFVYLRTSIRSTERIHIHTCYILYMCIYNFSMCTSLLPAPLCRSRSNNFRDSEIRASIRSIDVIALLHIIIDSRRPSIRNFVLANSNRFESLEGLPRTRILIRRIWSTINNKSVNQGQGKRALHEITSRIG